jgi:hypothetical protein
VIRTPGGRPDPAQLLVREGPAVALLLATNAVPLLGVAFGGWTLGTVMALYWLENGIVGVLNVPRIALAALQVARRSPTSTPEPWTAASAFRAAGAFALIPLFIFHYGLFWFVHGVFVGALFAGIGPFGEVGAFGGATATTRADLSAVATGLIGLTLYHVIAFVYRDLIRGEASRMTPSDVMNEPYGRVIVLHLTLIFGAFLVVMSGQTIAPLILLVVLKTALQLGLLVRSRAKLEDA